jgi:hypothetical protein
MKKPYLLLCIVVLFSTGCSAYISRGAGRGRDILKGGATREVISARFGKPLEAPPDWVVKEANRAVYTNESWTVWKIRGRPTRIDDGGAQFMFNALTLGTGEVIILPLTLIEEGSNVFRTYYLIGVFDANGGLLRHHGHEAR